MEDNNNKKCSLLEHKEIDAIIYCKECGIQMCNRCNNHHSSLFKSHNTYKLDKENIKDIFTGFCKEENHLEKLEFFCKNHNKLCCASCLCKIKQKNKGQHSDCNVCTIEEIKVEKKNNLNDNIKYLDNLSKNIDETINNLKNIFEKINEDKEKLKLEIQNIFTKLRNIINEREDQLLFSVDEQFDDFIFKKELIKKCKKLPNKITISLEEGKKLIKNWDENKLNESINDCLNIENNIKEINEIEEIMNELDLKVIFTPTEEVINKLIDSIKIFGNIKIISNISDVGFPSEILKYFDDKKLILSWLPKKPNKITLLLNSKKDGDSVKTLIEKCKGKAPMLVIIQTTKDIIFGGYTTIEWNDKYINDEKAFVFSLRTKKKYKVKNPKYAICASENNWWGFGPCENAIVIYNNCLKNSLNYVGNGSYDIPQPYELNGGEKYFNVKSYEIFHIE